MKIKAISRLNQSLVIVEREMPNAQRAVDCLTALETYFQQQNETIKLAVSRNDLTTATIILTAAIEHANTQKKVAQAFRADSSWILGSGALKRDYADRFVRVTTLCEETAQLKAEYELKLLATERPEHKALRERLANESVEKLRILGIEMKGMGNLRQASTLLTQLKDHITKQKAAAATSASHGHFDAASLILTAAIVFADGQIAKALAERQQAKQKDKHAPIFAAYPDLHRDVDTLYKTMGPLKADYDEAALERAAQAERELADAERTTQTERERADAERADVELAAQAKRERADAELAAQAKRERADAELAAQAERERAAAELAAQAERERAAAEITARELAERVRLELHKLTRGMGNLRTATSILNQLKQHMTDQTALALTAADTGDFSKASRILTATIIFADEQKAKAATERSKTKYKNNSVLLTRYPLLESEVDELCKKMRTLKARYDKSAQAELERAAAERATQEELERAAAERATQEELERAAADRATQEELERAAADRATQTVVNTPTDKHKSEDTEGAVSYEEHDEEQNYEKALGSLLDLKTKDHHADLDEPLDKLIDHIQKLKQEGKESTNELTIAVTKTHQRLTGELSPELYAEYANTAQGKSSIGLQILGGLMIALSIAAVVLGVVFFPALMGVAAAASLTGTAATATAGASIGVTSLLLGTGGAGFFVLGRQKGLSKALCNVNQAQLNTEAEPEHEYTAAPAA